jgi:hypothetical protein
MARQPGPAVREHDHALLLLKVLSAMKCRTRTRSRSRKQQSIHHAGSAGPPALGTLMAHDS